MRTIIVFSTQNNERKELSSSAATWGDLKNELSTIDMTANGMKAMVRETKNSLDNAAAVLPTGAFTLFLTPDRVKSGKLPQIISLMGVRI